MGATHGAHGQRRLALLATLIIAIAGVLIAAPPSHAATAHHARAVTPTVVGGNYTPFRLRYGTVISDVVNSSLAIEAYYSVHNAYPVNSRQVGIALRGHQVTLYGGTHLTIQTDGQSGYCVLGWALGPYLPPNYKVYDALKGGLQADSVHSCAYSYSTTFTYPS